MSTPEEAEGRTPAVIDAYLELLDRQIVDSEGRMVGKVDDVEVAERDDGRIVVTALLTGPGALGPRLGGALGNVVVGTWSRLSGRRPEEPQRIDWSRIASVGTVIDLTVTRATVAVDGFERWLRDRVVAAIPGSEVEPE
jgi:sporulation protein YlmC with PRC-barrel domain